MEDMKYLGHYDMKVSVGIMDGERNFRLIHGTLIQEQVCMCWQDMRMKVTGNC